ncbi:MAG: LTA synthase family protein, partial [Eubacterium sp.]|nr:LTA synthase family protein [Eubacterium sp.]
VIILIPVYIVLMLTLFFTGPNYQIWTLYGSKKAFAFQIFLVLLIEILLIGILKKGKRAFVVLGVLAAILGWGNQIKFAFMGEPVAFSDLLHWNNAGEIVGLVEGELWKTILLHIVPLLVETVLILVFVFWGRGVWEDTQLSNKMRVGAIIIPCILMVLLVAPIKPINKFVLRNVYDIDQRTKKEAYFITMSHYYTHFGLVGGIYGNLLEDRIWEPDDYDEKVVTKTLDNAECNVEKTLGKPNIIVVFSESFWDIDQLDEVTFNQKVTPNYNRLKEEGLFFNMISPSYGGMSANIEYEFLTGSNMMYFNYGYIPYMQLYRDDSYYHRPTIIQELKKNGYKTKITSGFSSVLYNCGNVYEHMGVDETEYITEAEEKDKRGEYLSDEFFTDKIISGLEHKKKDERLFHMTLTTQSHMPYPIDKYADYDVWVTKSDLSKDLNDTLTSYAQGLYDADKQLGRLVDYIKTMDEPTIVVFFGDHLPYLYAGKVNALDKLKFFNTEDEKLNEFRKYNTQSLVISNFKIKKDSEELHYLGPDLLSAYLLNHMDIKISNYYQWLYSCRNTIAASNYLIAVDQKGKLYGTMSLDGEMKKMYDLRKNIEYKLFLKKE